MTKESHLRALRALVQPLAVSQAIGSKPNLVVWADVRDALEGLLKECDAGRSEKKVEIRAKIYLDPDLEPRKKSGSGQRRRKRGSGRAATSSVQEKTEESSSSLRS